MGVQGRSGPQSKLNPLPKYGAPPWNARKRVVRTPTCCQTLAQHLSAHLSASKTVDTFSHHQKGLTHVDGACPGVPYPLNSRRARLRRVFCVCWCTRMVLQDESNKTA